MLKKRLKFVLKITWGEDLGVKYLLGYTVKKGLRFSRPQQDVTY
jgi:hypothetical protein